MMQNVNKKQEYLCFASVISYIKRAILEIAREYRLKKVKLFGSYANNKASVDSDIDLLVEFCNNDVILLTSSGLKYRL